MDPYLLNPLDTDIGDPDFGVIDSFDDDYYYYENYTNDIALDDLEMCHVKYHVNEVAQALTTTFSLPGIFANLIVVFVILVRKEYSISGTHWLTLQILLMNMLFLLFAFLQKINHHHESWIMGKWMCKIDVALQMSSSAAVKMFLAVANIIGISSLSGLTRWLSTKCSLKARKCYEPVKWLLAFTFVIAPCVVMNLPLYLYSRVNSCQRCIVEFPISATEICELIGLNATSCTDVIDLLSTGKNVTANYFEEYDYELSGDEYNFTMGLKIIDENMTNIAKMKACTYEEPTSFYAWLVSSFAVFYVFPVVIVAFFGFVCFWETTKPKTSKRESKVPVLRFLLVLDIFFVICWTPWHVVHLKKAYGGLGSSGSECASMVNYSAFVSVLFHAFAPIVYAFMTGNFSSRLSKALNATTSFCYQLLSYGDEYSEEGSVDILLRKSERKDPEQRNSFKEAITPYGTGTGV